ATNRTATARGRAADAPPSAPWPANPAASPATTSDAGTIGDDMAGRRYFADSMRVCTVTDRQRLPETRILAETFTRHHPGERLAVLVTDGRFGGIRDDEPFERIEPSFLELPALLYRAYEVG